MGHCPNCGYETFGSTYCSCDRREFAETNSALSRYECDEDFYICQELDKSYKARLPRLDPAAKTLFEILVDIDDRRLEEEEAIEMFDIWEEIDMNLLPIEFHQPGTKSRDGFKRFIHACGDYQDTYALRYHPGAKRHLKREASRARRKMDKVVVLDLAA